MMSAKARQITESQESVAAHEVELGDLKEALDSLGVVELCPEVTYDSLEQALNHKNTLDGLERDLVIKDAETNPYQEQIEELKNTAVQEIDWNVVNNLVRIK
jgi:hypothetical protein